MTTNSKKQITKLEARLESIITIVRAVSEDMENNALEKLSREDFDREYMKHGLYMETILNELYTTAEDLEQLSADINEMQSNNNIGATE